MTARGPQSAAQVYMHKMLSIANCEGVESFVLEMDTV